MIIIIRMIVEQYFYAKIIEIFMIHDKNGILIILLLLLSLIVNNALWQTIMHYLYSSQK